MKEPTLVITRTPAERQRAHEIQVFYALGLPGMKLLASPKPPEVASTVKSDAARSPKPNVPLIHRCQCGVPISRNKSACRMCYEIRLMDLGATIESQERLDELLNDLEPADRKEALEKITPYLKFRQKKETSCPNV